MSTQKDGMEEIIAGDIMLRRVMKAWGDGKTIREIAIITGLSTAKVMKHLKSGQKRIVKIG